MIFSELLEIGDEVVFKVDRETRAWTNTYKDVPDGTRGVVCGFYDAVTYIPRVPFLVNQPGVYHSKGAVSVWLPDGRIVPGGYSIDLVDQEERARRDNQFRDERRHFIHQETRIGDLPNTTFWEYDKVRVHFSHDGSVQEDMVIERIDYQRLHDQCDDRSPYPFYSVRGSRGTTSVQESQIELIERGNVWKFYNKQTLSFVDIKEEAAFFQLIGHTEEVRNPANDLYCWTKEEVLAAIKNGTVHGFSMSSGFFGAEPQIRAQRFKDPMLGERVAKATLEGFNIAA